jgi:hypothetical protein
MGEDCLGIWVPHYSLLLWFFLVIVMAVLYCLGLKVGILHPIGILMKLEPSSYILAAILDQLVWPAHLGYSTWNLKRQLGHLGLQD